MQVNEIFSSIQGEGIYAGVPMTFVRLQGCNLNCPWCDTSYAQNPKEGKFMSWEEIVDEVVILESVPVEDVGRLKRWVCITGGEPLLQEPDLFGLVQGLNSEGYKVEIETNGTFLPPLWYRLVDSWVADDKTPSSKSPRANSNWLGLRPKDQVKYVVANNDDLKFIKDRLSEGNVKVEVIVSPMMPSEQSWLQEVWEFCEREGLRFSLQLHKIVWNNLKGV